MIPDYFTFLLPMEMPGRRCNYSPLSQFPNPAEEQRQSKYTGAHFGYESHSPDKNKAKAERAFDWAIGSDGDHRSAGLGLQQGGRIGALFPSIGLQRQSSGSSFGESSLSGEFHLPTLSPSVSLSANDPDMFSPLQEEAWKNGGDGRLKPVEAAGSSSLRSWAQQTEESYQLQLALALRLSSEASSSDDPNLFGPPLDDSSISSPRSCAEPLSHRFWVNNCLSYHDKVPDGFYLIHGMDPYVWTICTDLQENGRVPSIESLKAVDSSDSSIQAVLIDKRGDSSLKELQHKVIGLSHNCSTTREVVEQLAKLVSFRMGGACSTEEGDLVACWKDRCKMLKECLGSVVLPMGNLSVGLCGHRALLFKVLADTIDLPCRIARGCKYCRRDDASSCLVWFRVDSLDREYLVDLIGKPGFLCEPVSLLNGLSSISISSPLRLPKFKSVEITENVRSLAKQCLLDCQSLNLIFDDASAGTNVGQEDETDPSSSKYIGYVKYLSPVLSNNDEISEPGIHIDNKKAASPKDHDETQLQEWHNPFKKEGFVKDSIPPKPVQSVEHRDIQPISALPDPRADKSKDFRHVDCGQLIPNKSNSELLHDVDDLDIPWSDLILKERIGAGSFGAVHRADWHGSDVAVKILMEKDFHLHEERFKEFLREVAIMKCLRHPNIVLFMGAVTRPPNLSIVTEYLARGSLYRLLHKPGPREILDERRRLSMAYDVAKGMNYLHRHNPPIVHRDLKSPNLLVDKKWTVKVCDFGLSRLKANTFLSSKSTAGTPEWMAPEVLRDEPSNEKSDVYSFGVILWELMTMQQPWSSLNHAQVVAAVGFKGRRLEIPSDINPQVASIIESCWANEPRKRPSFSVIMESLRSLIKFPTATAD